MKAAQDSIVLAVLLAALLAMVNSTSAQEMRTWTDTTGNFSLEAKFLSETDGTVLLQQADGSQRKIPLQLLSSIDRAYVQLQKTAAAANPFQPVEQNPFKPVTPETPASGAAAGGAKAGRSVEPDWSSVREVTLTPTNQQWNFPAPAFTGSAPSAIGRPTKVPPTTDFFEREAGLVVNAQSRRAVIAFTLDKNEHDLDGEKVRGQTRIVLCDLDSGRSLPPEVLPGTMTPLALHDNGRTVLLHRRELGRSKFNLLELWSITSSGAKRELQWIPYDSGRGRGEGVPWAAFVDERRLLTMSDRGKLARWDVVTGQPSYVLQCQGGSAPALSPDRKLLAFTTDKELGVLDVDRGKVVATQPVERMAWPTLAFSPSGARLVCADHSTLYVWDFTTGQLQREMMLKSINARGELLFPTEDHVLAGKNWLLDLESQVKLWQYSGHKQVASVGAVCWFHVSQGEKTDGALVPAKIPHEGVAQALAKAMQQPDFFVLKPGATISVDVEGISDAAQRTEVYDALSERLMADGFKIDKDNATIELVATTEESPKPHEISYRTFGGGFGNVKTYHVREFVSRVKFVYQGETAWETRATNIPGIIHLSEGETTDQYLRKREKPNYAFFDSVELPKLLTKPTGSPTLGTTQVTVTGLR